MADAHEIKYIRAKQLERRYGIDRVTAWRWGRDKSMGFPKPIRVTSSVSVYDKAKVDAWFEARGNMRPRNDG